jgi:hypothetical protein
METNMSQHTFRAFLFGAVVIALWGLASIQPRAEEKDTAALAAGMKEVQATVEQGLASAGKSGRPISAKFELDDGEVQLSVYVENSMGFREVLANPHTGIAVGATLLTDEGDLKDAQEQSAAMAKATTTLLAATQHAVAANPGARAISIYPELQNGHPVATVTLLRDDTFTKVTEKLD